MSGAASEAISHYGINQLKIASSLRSSITASCLIYLLHGPGQPLIRFPASPSPCSRRNDELIRSSLIGIQQCMQQVVLKDPVPGEELMLFTKKHGMSGGHRRDCGKPWQ
jgi:hypothetical protein